MKRHAIFLAILAFSQPLAAADLLQTYREARANDPAYASARAARDAGRESLPQGLALLLPTISASAYTQMNDIDIDFRDAAPSSKREGNTNGYSVSLTQPLFNWQSIVLYKEAGFKVAQAEAVFGQAAQDLIVRVAQAYFDVLASQDSLAFIQAQKTAISEQLAQAKRNFEVGTATITDTHEAQARFDLSASQEIAAQSDLEIKKSALQQIIGKFPDRLAPLKPLTELSPPTPHAMEQWVASAEDRSFAVRIQQAALEIASREIERSRAGHYPSLNLVGSYGSNSAGISTAGTVSLGTDSTSRSIGLQLAIPLYAGGGVNSLVRQALANREKARQDLETARRSAAQAARQAYLGVTSGMAQVSALEQALVSSQSALDSNKLGYEVGVRINIDVLNAQQQLFSTKRDLSKARYDTLLNGLKLKSASGTLTEEDLEAVNRLLGSD
ncbi:MAG: channel protein TolC [Betaproteobacteria bacterium RIFCSPLOWO2_12_FULL_64_23]|nr:MAG: channel protein TolC [Betaproteobacteria bacterium RIFCSPLOWO2_12_FULL_64_23]